MSTTFWHEIESPVGCLLIAGTADALTRIQFQAGPRPLRPPQEWRCESAPFTQVVTQLQEYFAGARREFDVPLAPRGTPFQLTVWRALSEIPYGQTVSYGELARR